MMRGAYYLLACLLAMPTVAAADQIQLVGGGSIEGVVLEDGEALVIQMDMGTVSIPRSEVVRIVRGDSALDELGRRRAKVRDGDVAGLFRLARWAQSAGLGSRALSIAREVLVLRRDHVEARAMLGYTKIDGRWMTPDEVMRHRGFVRHGAGWLSPEQVKARDEARRLAVAEAEARARVARFARLEAEVAAARAAAETAAQAATARSQMMVPWFYGAPVLRSPPRGPTGQLTSQLGALSGLAGHLQLGFALPRGVVHQGTLVLHGARPPVRQLGR